MLSSLSPLSTSSSITAIASTPLSRARVAEGDRVEPAAAARAAGDRAVFVAAVAQVLAELVVELGGKRPAADARRIGLHHADDVVDVPHRHAGAAGDADARAVAAGDERIRAVVDVEQRALRAFEQDPLAASAAVSSSSVVSQTYGRSRSANFEYSL